MGIKIMMPPEVVDSVAGALIAKQVLREIVRNAVKTPFDEHYFAVIMHKGVSKSLHRLSFLDLAKLLSCSTGKVHKLLADHMVYGSARGGCRVCNAASHELKELIIEEKDKDHGAGDSMSLFILMSAALSQRRQPSAYAAMPALRVKA